ncbi:MAG: hypothetical protein IT436_00025 [Phycisphaerales bacterium]|nr:hypothetical protein [Phycisphaerales bacterium]
MRLITSFLGSLCVAVVAAVLGFDGACSTAIGEVVSLPAGQTTDDCRTLLQRLSTDHQLSKRDTFASQYYKLESLQGVGEHAFGETVSESPRTVEKLVFGFEVDKSLAADLQTMRLKIWCDSALSIDCRFLDFFVSADKSGEAVGKTTVECSSSNAYRTEAAVGNGISSALCFVSTWAIPYERSIKIAITREMPGRRTVFCIADSRARDDYLKLWNIKLLSTNERTATEAGGKRAIDMSNSGAVLLVDAACNASGSSVAADTTSCNAALRWCEQLRKESRMIEVAEDVRLPHVFAGPDISKIALSTLEAKSGAPRNAPLFFRWYECVKR